MPHIISSPDLISQLLDPVIDPWLERETCYKTISVPESYTGPRISFPLSVSDTNALLSAFKEQQVPIVKLSFIFPVAKFSRFKYRGPLFSHRFYMQGMSCSCCTRPKSSLNRCQILSICQHPTPRTSPYVVSNLSLNSPC